MQGTVLVFLAEALLPLTGIVTAAFLTRKLGAGDYGLLTLSATLITWIELAVGGLLARATIKVVADAEDWRPLGAAVLRLHFLVSIGAMVACWALAKPCAVLLGEPKLAGYLALFSVDLPILSLAQCHQNILVGRGRYAERAMVGAGRWIARLVLIILLVELGLSINGAILGSVGASLVELAIARYYIRPSWSARTMVPLSLWDYAVPIFLATLILRFLGLDLFMLKMLGVSVAQVGIYGAAQNVSFVMPGVVATSFSPVLLSTITQVMRESNLSGARTLGRNTIRITTAMLPLAVAAAAASNDIAILLFGAEFAGAGSLIAILVIAGFAIMMTSLLSAVLIAFGKPSWTLNLVAPLLPIAIAGHFFAIPRFGPIGAASVTAIVMGAGGLAGVIAVRRLLEIRLPVATFLRSFLLSGMTYPLIHFWPLHGLGIVVKLTAVIALTLAGFIALGELRQHEIHFFRSAVRQTLFRKWTAG